MFFSTKFGITSSPSTTVVDALSSHFCPGKVQIAMCFFWWMSPTASFHLSVRRFTSFIRSFMIFLTALVTPLIIRWPARVTSMIDKCSNKHMISHQLPTNQLSQFCLVGYLAKLEAFLLGFQLTFWSSSSVLQHKESSTLKRLFRKDCF